MRILFLCKRQYTGKDLLDDRYGRLFEFPRILSQRGHHVAGLSVSYRPRRQGEYSWGEFPRLSWRSLNLASIRLLWLPASIIRFAREFRPDLVIASSDAWHLGIAQWVAARIGVPLVVDLYDNYESFGLSKLPGARALIRNACRRAVGVATVSRRLANLVVINYGCQNEVRVVGNGVDTRIFHVRDKEQCRNKLSLPATGLLIGTAGALTAGRGVGDLQEAFLRLAQERSDVWLVLAGKRDGSLMPLRHPRLIELGELPHDKVGLLLSSLDVGVVCNRDTPFGHYCFPLKLHEMMAAGIPVVAARVGDVSEVLADTPQSLYQPGDIADLADKLMRLATEPERSASSLYRSWEAMTDELEVWLGGLLESANGARPLATE
tara:strand:+ start:5786 stop:6919 length:1134 start_codon:yes stop_codon:yes gene_type:complete